MRNISEKRIASSIAISTGSSYGSGILITYNHYLYLITARHVLFNKNKENNFLPINTTINISCPTVVNDDRTTRKLEISLTTDNYVFNPNFDIAVIKLGVTEKSKSTWKVYYDECVVETDSSLNNPLLISEKTFKLINSVIISNDVYLFGYPTSLGIENYQEFFDTDKPILRRGIISYINKAKKHIILDCPVYAGNSGGPAFEVTSVNGRKKYSLIGIISRYIPYRQEWYNMRDNYKNFEYVNSGYSVAIAMDVVIETINLFPPNKVYNP